MTYSLPSGIVSQFQEFADAFQTEFGAACKAIFPSFETPCVNCVVNTMNHTSSNQYNGTGPVPFPSGSICPWCDGVGYKRVEQTETVQLRIYYKPKEWYKFGIPIEKSQNVIRVRGYASDLPKLSQCEYLEVTNAVQFGSARYKRLGDFALGGLVEKKYFWSFWEKV